MNVEITGIHLNVSEEIKEAIDKKIEKLDFAKDYVHDLNFKLIQEKDRMYKVEVNIHFRWGIVAHISVDGFDVFEELDKIFDKIAAKIRKEKSKIQDHH